MPKQSTNPQHRPKRDLELCKVVFGAAISQVLYARRAFAPACFQVLPLEQVVSRSFDDIVTSGTKAQLHDKELLRDQNSTVFLRQGQHYDISRFLGILREDIFPLIETESLVKFRINYLRTKAWAENCLAEYYTISLKYELDGRYGLDVWRAGTGKQHISTGDSQLWNLGDYLSRLPSWTEDMHWTLAFHATERPDDPPIGVWKFDRTSFDDANLALQQRSGYSYARIAKLEIMPSPLKNTAETVIELSSDPEPDFPFHQQMQPVVQSSEASSPAIRKQGTKAGAKTREKPSKSRARGAVAAKRSTTRKRSPRGKASKKAAADAEPEAKVTAEIASNGTAQNGKSQNEQNIPKAASAKGPVPRRKPKRPLIFDDAASSLPATQVIGESQLSQRAQLMKRPGDHGLNPTSTPQKRLKSDIPRSPSLDGFGLLGDIALSSDAVSETDESSSRMALPPRAHASNHHEGYGEATSDELGSLSKPGTASSVSLGFRGPQWELQASPPENLLGITISDDEEETASEEEDEAQTLPQRPVDSVQETGISYSFEPNTVARRTSLFYDIPEDSDEE